MRNYRPILMAGDMVRAIFAGDKTETRRVIKGDISNIRPVPRHMENENDWGKWLVEYEDGETKIIDCPYGGEGDRLWVRETWAKVCEKPDGECEWPGCDYDYIDYRADHEPPARYPGGWPDSSGRKDVPEAIKWKPSIFMPRWASRIRLDLVEVRAEKLTEITDTEAQAEGVKLPANTVTMYEGIYVDQFALLWQRINGIESWNDTVWVWVLKFKQVV